MRRRMRSGMLRIIRTVNPTGDCLFVAILVQLLALGLLDPSFSKAVLADEDTAGVQFRMQIYNYIIANRARFRAMAFWMDDSQWVRFLHELVTPGRYKDVESEIVFMVVADMFGVRITVLMNDAPDANALSYLLQRTLEGHGYVDGGNRTAPAEQHEEDGALRRHTTCELV